MRVEYIFPKHLKSVGGKSSTAVSSMRGHRNEALQRAGQRGTGRRCFMTERTEKLMFESRNRISAFKSAIHNNGSVHSLNPDTF